jgi:hypothetical protein
MLLIDVVLFSAKSEDRENGGTHVRAGRKSYGYGVRYNPPHRLFQPRTIEFPEKLSPPTNSCKDIHQQVPIGLVERHLTDKRKGK